MCIQHIAFTIAGDLLDLASKNRLFHSAAVNSFGFAGQAEYLADLIQLHLCPGRERAQCVAEVIRHDTPS